MSTSDSDSSSATEVEDDAPLNPEPEAPPVHLDQSLIVQVVKGSGQPRERCEDYER